MKFELYNGEITMDFSEAAHRYKINGEFKQGVTTILNQVTAKDGLIHWSANLASKTFRTGIETLLRQNQAITPFELESLTEVARKAHTARKDKGADVGTQAHALIEQHIKAKINKEDTGVLGSPDTQVKHALEAFTEWETKYNPTYIKSEQPVYSRNHDYCGTMDCLAVIDGKTTMIDFKTGNPETDYRTGKTSCYPKDFLQCAAYDVAHAEEHKLFCDRYMVVYVTKTGVLHTFINDQVAKNVEAWECALVLSRRLEHLKKLAEET